MKNGKLVILKKRNTRNPKSYVRGKMIVRNNNEKCAYCDKPGIIYREHSDDFICEKRAWDCQGFRDYLSVLLVKAQNRDNVKEAKSKAMIELHSGNDDKSKQFKDNYFKGKQLFRDKKFNQYYDFLINAGYNKEDIPNDFKRRQGMVIECRWRERDRKQSLKKLKGVRVKEVWRACGELSIN